ELTPWEQEYLEEMYEQKEEYERQLKIMEEEQQEEAEEKLRESSEREAKRKEEKVAINDLGPPMPDDQTDDTHIDVEETEVVEVIGGAIKRADVVDGEVSAEFKEAKTEGDKEMGEVREGDEEGVHEEVTFIVLDVEEDVPDVWMVEDESLRTRKVSKRRGMIRKWVSNPCDKKGREPRGLEEAENRAKTMQAWLKRRVRARMRMGLDRRVQGRDARAHEAVNEGRAWKCARTRKKMVSRLATLTRKK
ncbi:Unknown protein, partial [Striga hermonthica]